MCDGLFVFVVCGPYGYFISFSSDVDDGSTHVVTVVVERFTHKTQELWTKDIFPNGLVTEEQILVVGSKRLQAFFQADILTSHKRKSTDVTNEFNDVSVLFKCPRKPQKNDCQHAPNHDPNTKAAKWNWDSFLFIYTSAFLAVMWLNVFLRIMGPHIWIIIKE